MSQGFSVAAQYVGGSFVQDLAKELGKSASTVASYLKKHLPATLLKLKNSNNRLANFCTAEGVESLRAHYSPAVAPETNALVQELERLRAENQQLRAKVQKLEIENKELHDFAKSNAPSCDNKPVTSMQKIRDAHSVTSSDVRLNLLKTLLLQEEEYNEQARASYNQKTLRRKETFDRADTNVVRFPNRK